MKRLIVSIVAVLLAASAFGHAGHTHTYMGTVTTLNGSSGFMMKTTAGKTITVTTTEATQYLHSDNRAAKAAELAVGERVVVKMNSDGKTAATVKMAANAKRAK